MKIKIIEGKQEYTDFINSSGDTAITSVLCQALVYKNKLTPEQYNTHLLERMEAGEPLKFYLLQNESGEIVAAAMGWRRGSVVNSPRIQIQAIAVDSNHRGNGLFYKLIDGILAEIKERGYKGIDVEVGLNSLQINSGLYLMMGGNPNEVMFAMDVNEKAGQLTHTQRINQERSINVLSNAFGRAKL